MEFQAGGAIEDFTTADQAQVEEQICSLLGCVAPACLLVLQVSSASIRVQATATMPNDLGASDAVTSAASGLRALSAGALSNLLGMQVESPLSYLVYEDVTATVVVAPPPPSIPAPPPSTPIDLDLQEGQTAGVAAQGAAAPGSDGERRTQRALNLMIALGGVAAGLVILVLIWAVKCRKDKKSAEPDLSATAPGVQAEDTPPPPLQLETLVVQWPEEEAKEQYVNPLEEQEQNVVAEFHRLASLVSEMSPVPGIPQLPTPNLWASTGMLASPESVGNLGSYIQEPTDRAAAALATEAINQEARARSLDSVPHVGAKTVASLPPPPPFQNDTSRESITYSKALQAGGVRGSGCDSGALRSSVSAPALGTSWAHVIASRSRARVGGNDPTFPVVVPEIETHRSPPRRQTTVTMDRIDQLSAMPQFVYRASPERSIAREASSGMPMSGWLRYRQPPRRSLQAVAERVAAAAMAEGDDETLAAALGQARPAKDDEYDDEPSPSLDPDYRSPPRVDFAYPRQTPYRRHRAPPSRTPPSRTDGDATASVAEDAAAHTLTRSLSAGGVLLTSPNAVPQRPDDDVEDEEKHDEPPGQEEHYFI